MTGPAEGKHILKNVKVYIHEAGKARARATHIDIESEELAQIIKPGETTYCAGKPGGCFIGLKKEMLERTKAFIGKRENSNGKITKTKGKRTLF